MNDIIHLLPDSVANQIAAGEVVQRPASIVKEMVENSIDAGAHNITVRILDGGKTSVQIIDDGKGMSETDARLSFERHATSKIASASDLFTLTTMGFRGEALASIAAVAQVELNTRRKEDELGTHIVISGSKIEVQEPVACPVGCNFAVKNLFFNVPARRKFLKSNQTEYSNILTEFDRMVLVHPDISFTLLNNNTEVLRLQEASVRQRIIDVFGKKINSELLTLEAETSLVSISGFVGKPESSRKKGSHQYFFVNGRYMKHPYFHSAVSHAFDNLIPTGEHVSYFIYLSVDPSTIDVNVHPTKTEIKFDNEQAIWQVLSAVVKEVLGKYSNVPTIDFDTEGKPDIPAMGTERTIPYQPKAVSSGYNPFSREGQYKRKSVEWEGLYAGLGSTQSNGADRDEASSEDVSDMPASFAPSSFMPSEYDDIAHQHDVQLPIWEESESDAQEWTEAISSTRFQYIGRYIVTPSRSGVMFVDQRRAHIRVLYEQYMQSLTDKRSVSQRVLFPEMIQFAHSELPTLDAIMKDLEYVGFELTNLGGGTFSINGVPTGIEGLNPEKLLRELVTAAMERGTDIKEDVHSAIAFTMAKSASIVYGQVLSDKEMLELLTGLFATSSPLRTPDGKVVFYVFEHSLVDAKF